MSKVLEALRNPSFAYARPWFYNHPLALRCELGQGEGRAYGKNAQRRALEIYDILFPKGPDVLFFDHYINDWDGPEGLTAAEVRRSLRFQRRESRFVLEAQRRFRHEIVRNLAPDGFTDPEDTARTNRILCWPQGSYDPRRRICRQVRGHWEPLVSFVSEENECIFSIYDDRGCDIVFFDGEKFRAFYPRLRPWFLEYDLELMEKRLGEE